MWSNKTELKHSVNYFFSILNKLPKCNIFSTVVFLQEYQTLVQRGDVKPQAIKFPLNVNRKHIWKTNIRFQLSQAADLFCTGQSCPTWKEYKFLTVTSEGKYWPSCSLCCLHLQIPSHPYPQSGSSHHHHNCTPDSPLALQVTDNSQVRKWGKNASPVLTWEKQMCQFGNSKCCNLWFTKINITYIMPQVYLKHFLYII